MNHLLLILAAICAALVILLLVVRAISGRLAQKNYRPPRPHARAVEPRPPAKPESERRIEDLRFCVYCGGVLDLDGKRCPRCGRK